MYKEQVHGFCTGWGSDSGTKDGRVPKASQRAASESSPKPGWLGRQHQQTDTQVRSWGLFRGSNCDKVHEEHSGDGEFASLLGIMASGRALQSQAPVFGEVVSIESLTTDRMLGSGI